MRIRLNHRRPESLISQARDQIVAALHAGLVRDGQRLPSLRSVARQSKLNVKTVMKVYTQLQREGLLAIRPGSGTFLKVHEPRAIEPARALSIGRMLRRHFEEAATMDLGPERYVALSRLLITRHRLRKASVAVLECNQEQIQLFAREISARIGVAAHPLLLNDRYSRREESLLRGSSILATTDFHHREGADLARKHGMPLLRLRLRKDFLTTIMASCRRGRLIMIVSETSFFPALRRSLGDLGLEPEALERIQVVACKDRRTVAHAVARADFVYVSPLCPQSLWELIPRKARAVHFRNHVADETIEELEAWLLLSGGAGDQAGPSR